MHDRPKDDDFTIVGKKLIWPEIAIMKPCSLLVRVATTKKPW